MATTPEIVAWRYRYVRAGIYAPFDHIAYDGNWHFVENLDERYDRSAWEVEPLYLGDDDALEIGRFVQSGGWVKPSKITNGQFIAWTKEDIDGAGPTLIEAIRTARQHEAEVHAKRAAAVAAG